MSFPNTKIALTSNNNNNNNNPKWYIWCEDAFETLVNLQAKDSIESITGYENSRENGTISSLDRIG